jgi:hypothetical protein
MFALREQRSLLHAEGLILLLLLITGSIHRKKILVSIGSKHPLIWIKSLRALLKLIVGFTNARKRFLYFLDLHFSSLVNLRYPFSLFIAHWTIAFIKTSLADERNTRLAYGLASLRTWKKCCCDCNGFTALYRCKHRSYFVGKQPFSEF